MDRLPGHVLSAAQAGHVYRHGVQRLSTGLDAVQGEHVPLFMVQQLCGGHARPLATLAISGPAFRVNEHSLPVLLAELEPAAAKISWRAASLKCG
jgi:hypothetical protein